MDSRLVNVYAAMGDKLERDPIGPDGSGRATVVNGRGWQKYQRFTREGVVWVQTPEGKDVWLTRTQVEVYHLALTFVDNGTTAIRTMARTLGKAPSTVSRAITKLVAFGLLIAIGSRGRYAAMLILRLPKDGSLARYRKAAKMRVRRWYEASQRRLSRLAFNVAPYDIQEERVLTTSTSNYGRNIETWSVQDMREAGIL